MALTSSIVPYDADWPRQYADEAARLVSVLGARLIAMHHVGSTAVPALAAKPEIDVLAVVDIAEIPPEWTAEFGMLGYRRGGDLSPGHRFFKRDVAQTRTHKLHICNPGHATIAEMLVFRDHLRRTPDDRDRYAALKLRLERENLSGIGQYLAGKAPFIRSVLTAIGKHSLELPDR